LVAYVDPSVRRVFHTQVVEPIRAHGFALARRVGVEVCGWRNVDLGLSAIGQLLKIVVKRAILLHDYHEMVDWNLFADWRANI
jgi:hypothetical protein